MAAGSSPLNRVSLMPDCQWIAWRDHLPKGDPTLLVQGDCSFPQPGFSVELRRPLPPSPSAQPPVVRGPSVVERGAGPPAFQVDPGPSRFYAIEVTTNSSLFAPGVNLAQLPADQFYASWQSGGLLPPGQFTLPPTVWARLQGADFLFYRIATSSSPTSWVNPMRSLGQDGSDPFLSIVDSAAGLDAPSLMVLACLITPPAGSPAPQVTVVHCAYKEVTTGPYTTTTILPQGVSVAIEDVF